MKGWLIKLLCIAGAGVVGVLMTGEFFAAVLTAPFGWILGRAIELNAEVRRMEKSVILQTNTLQQLNNNTDEDEWDRAPYSVIYSDPGSVAKSAYVVLPSNIWCDDDENF